MRHKDSREREFTLTESQKEYHRSLHETIWACTKLADWIYHDVRLDCDGEAGTRMADRISHIAEQHGNEAVFGVVGSWASKTIGRIEASIIASGETMPPLRTVLDEE